METGDVISGGKQRNAASRSSFLRAAAITLALAVSASPSVFGASIHRTDSVIVNGLTFKGPTTRDFPLLGTRGVFPIDVSPIIFIAPAQFPDGATLQRMEVAAWRDSSSTRTLEVTLRELCDSPSVCTPSDQFPTVAVSGSGYTRSSADLTFPPVNNRMRLYTLTASFAGPGAPDTLQLISVRVTFERNVTPAPSSPTYDDVPSDLPSFQFIEAMAAARLALPDCAPRRHCPDAIVTQGEFASVFTRAIGLFTYERKVPSRRRPVRPFFQP
jgi:hypothetical protein